MRIVGGQQTAQKKRVLTQKGIAKSLEEVTLPKASTKSRLKVFRGESCTLLDLHFMPSLVFG